MRDAWLLFLFTAAAAAVTCVAAQPEPLELRYFFTFPYQPDGFTLREFCIPLGTMQRVNLTLTFSVNVAYSATRTFNSTVNVVGATELLDAGPTRGVFFTHPQPSFFPGPAPFVWVQVRNNDPSETLQFGWATSVEDGWGPISPSTTAYASVITLGKRCLDTVGNNNQFQGVERFGNQPLNLTFPLRGVTTAQIFYPSTFQGLGVNHFPTNLVDARGMFHKCPQQASQLPLLLSAWDTEVTARSLTPFSTVRDMRYMFGECSTFVGHPLLSRFVTSNVTNMDYMFYQSPLFNTDISGWDTCAVTSMNNMLNGAAAFNQNLRGWCARGFARSSAPSFFAFGAPLMSDVELPAWGYDPPLVLATTSDSEVPKPSPRLVGLNAYCAESILANNAARPCRRLLQAMPVYEPTFNTSYNNYVAVEFYPNTRMGEFNQSSLIRDSFAPEQTQYVNRTGLAAEVAAGIRMIPQEITFAIPSCSSEPPRLVTSADVSLGLRAYGYSSRADLGGGATASAQLGFVSLFQATPSCAGTWIMNYRHIPANGPSSLYDMNCGTLSNLGNPTTFEQCLNSQITVPFVAPTNVYSALNQSWFNTSAVAPAVYDNLARSSLVSSVDRCASAGTDLWLSREGIQYARTRGRCIPAGDAGSVGPFWGTLTYILSSPSSCEAFLNALPASRGALQFLFKGAALITDPNTTALSAAPVRMRMRSSDAPGMERVGYVPFAQCEPASPRSLLATKLSPQIYLKPHCRASRRGGAYNINIETAVPSELSPTPSVITAVLPDGAVVYVLTADGIPYGSVKLYAKVAFETNNTQQNYVTRELYFGVESRTFVVNANSLFYRMITKVSLQRFSPDNPYQLWIREAEVSGLESCQCNVNVPCSVSNVLQTETEHPITNIFASPVSLVQPVCRIVLRDGYLGKYNWVLRNRVHTLDSKYFPYTGNTFAWDTSVDSAGFVQTQAQTAGVSSTPFFAFRVTARVPQVTMRLRITSAGGLTNFCDITMQVYEGEPVAELSPAEAFFGVGQTVELDGSRSFTPTGEDLFWFWRLGFPINTTGIVLSQTGNSSRINVTAVEPGFYGVIMFACNPRTCRGVQARLTVVANPVPARNNTLTNCFSSINNAIEFDPVQAPIKPAEFRAFSNDMRALRWGTAGDYARAEQLRAQAANETQLPPEQVLARQIALFAYLSGVGLFTLVIVVVVLVVLVALVVDWARSCARDRNTKPSSKAAR